MTPSSRAYLSLRSGTKKVKSAQMREIDKCQRKIQIGVVTMGLLTCDECGEVPSEELARKFVDDALRERLCLICRKPMIFVEAMIWHWCATDKRPERNPRWNIYIEDAGDTAFRVKVEACQANFCLEGAVHWTCAARAIPGMRRFDFSGKVTQKG